MVLPRRRENRPPYSSAPIIKIAEIQFPDPRPAALRDGNSTPFTGAGVSIGELGEDFGLQEADDTHYEKRVENAPGSRARERIPGGLKHKRAPQAVQALTMWDIRPPRRIVRRAEYAAGLPPGIMSRYARTGWSPARAGR